MTALAMYSPALEGPPRWRTAHGELRRTTWRLDGLAMSSWGFAAESHGGQVIVRAEPRPGSDFASGPGHPSAHDASPEAVALTTARALLRPSHTLERLALEPVAERWIASRMVRLLLGRLHGGAEPPFGMLLRADTYRFSIDMRRGAALQATGLAEGSVIERVELAGLKFDLRERIDIGSRR